jgi:hypothetical protein
MDRKPPYDPSPMVWWLMAAVLFVAGLVVYISVR